MISSNLFFSLFSALIDISMDHKQIYRHLTVTEHRICVIGIVHVQFVCFSVDKYRKGICFRIFISRYSRYISNRNLCISYTVAMQLPSFFLVSIQSYNTVGIYLFAVIIPGFLVINSYISNSCFHPAFAVWIITILNRYSYPIWNEYCILHKNRLRPLASNQIRINILRVIQCNSCSAAGNLCITDLYSYIDIKPIVISHGFLNCVQGPSMECDAGFRILGIKLCGITKRCKIAVFIPGSDLPVCRIYALSQVFRIQIQCHVLV